MVSQGAGKGARYQHQPKESKGEQGTPFSKHSSTRYKGPIERRSSSKAGKGWTQSTHPCQGGTFRACLIRYSIPSGDSYVAQICSAIHCFLSIATGGWWHSLFDCVHIGQFHR